MMSGRKLMLLVILCALSGYGMSVYAASETGCRNASVTAHDTGAPGLSDCSSDTPAVVATPEIDGAGALGAMVILGGVLALVGERRRRGKS